MTTTLDRSPFDARAAAYATLLLRVSLGLVFLAHGLLKVLVFGVSGTAAFFVDHGYPGWLALPVAVMELVGGPLLIAGFFTRWVAAALLPVLAGAFLVHWPAGWSFTAPGGGWEYVAFLISATLAQIGLGSGAWSLDDRIAQRRTAERRTAER